jgi:glycosyltransferase involved in cell wall biosynthesis
MVEYKIIHVTNYYFPTTGGITTQIAYMQALFSEKGVKSYVFAFPYMFRVIERWIGSKFLRKILHFIFVAYFLIISVLKTFAIKLFNRNVIVQSHDAYFCALIGIISRSFGCRSTHIFRTVFNYRKRLRYKKIQKAIFSRCDALSFVSEFMKKEFIKEFDVTDRKTLNKLHITRGGIDTDRYAPHKTDDLIFEYADFDRPIILSVGNLFNEKRPQTVIKAVSRLKSKYPTMTVIMIGDGDMKDSLLAQARELDVNLYLTGKIPVDRVSFYYNFCDVLVHPSAKEAAGNTIIEAMSCGKPVVATTTGGNPEIVDNGANGYLTAIDDHVAMAEKIDKILSDEKLRNEFSENARYKVMEKFTWDKAIKNFEKMYAEVLS